MAFIDSGRRLCLLVEAKKGRFALEAASVVEVAHPDISGLTIRGMLELSDLSNLWGAGPEVRPGVGLVLDTSPTLSLRVQKVVDVVDVSKDPFFVLPPLLGSALSPIVRGSLLHGSSLYLELEPEALAKMGSLTAPPQPVPRELAEPPPDRTLVFESQGTLFGLPLPFVSQVVTPTETYCPLPSPMGAACGLFAHAQSLWPIYSAPALMGNSAVREELLVLAEFAGQSVGVWATRALGVHQGFTPSDAPGVFVSSAVGTPVTFWDWQRMFS